MKSKPLYEMRIHPLIINRFENNLANFFCFESDSIGEDVSIHSYYDYLGKNFFNSVENIFYDLYERYGTVIVLSINLNTMKNFPFGLGEIVDKIVINPRLSYVPNDGNFLRKIKLDNYQEVLSLAKYLTRFNIKDAMIYTKHYPTCACQCIK
jgi:hypothetical protein